MAEQIPLLVLALYQRYKEEGAAFVPGYLELLATGGSASATIDILKKWGADRIKYVGILAAPVIGGFVAEGAFLASQRADVGMEDVIFFGADGIKAEDYITAAGDAAEGSFARPETDHFEYHRYLAFGQLV